MEDWEWPLFLELLKELFLDVDVDETTYCLNSSLAPSWPSDRLVWQSRMFFLSKSASHLGLHFMSRIKGVEVLSDDSLQKRFLKETLECSCTTKNNEFLWRVCWDMLLTRLNLERQFK